MEMLLISLNINQTENVVVRGENSFSLLKQSLPFIEQDLHNNIELILGHFNHPVFPRTISTYLSQGKQYEVYTKEQMLSSFVNSNCIDCRINGYPSYVGFREINRRQPDFIFIDLDRFSFISDIAHKRTLKKTLRNIKDKIGGHPTVLWSGRGYHIYQPVQAPIFEQIERFSKFDTPSVQFLRFAEGYFSDNKSDSAHNPSFRSCMIRVPGTYNSKCLIEKTMGAQVKLVQDWDGNRPYITEILGDFYVYLTSNKIKRDAKITAPKYSTNYHSQINWIELLLETPIDDYRKNAIGIILAPYLINIKGESIEEAESLIIKWIQKCDSLRKVDGNVKYKIKYDLRYSQRNKMKPIRLESLRNKNIQLYDLIKHKLSFNASTTNNK